MFLGEESLEEVSEIFSVFGLIFFSSRTRKPPQFDLGGGSGPSIPDGLPEPPAFPARAGTAGAPRLLGPYPDVWLRGIDTRACRRRQGSCTGSQCPYI